MKDFLISHSEKETQDIAFFIAKYLNVPSLLTLDGDLGAGKTQFAKGVGKYLGVKESISSPTFNILKCYFSGKIPFYHIDAYRLENGVNSDIGLEEVIEGNGITLIEWSSYISEMLFEPLSIKIEIVSNEERILTFESEYEKYSLVFEKIKEYKNGL